MSDEKQKKDSKDEKTSADPELDELLDSALKDFSKEDEAKMKPAEKKDESENSFMSLVDEYVNYASANFDSNMSTLLEGTPGGSGGITQEQIQQGLKEMAAVAAMVAQESQSANITSENTDFASTLSQTLQNLSLGAENLQNPMSQDDIMNMFNSDNPENHPFLPIMQGMMQSLLSKEVLYPSMKHILDAYPAWLEGKKGTISNSEYENYTKQMQLMNEVCQELEKEEENDDENVKKERFDKVLGLMQKMQEYGSPPAELIGEFENLPFDAQGNLQNDCSIM